MKILLVRPNIRVDSIVVPIGLAYIAKQLIDEHEVFILDCLKDNISYKNFLDFVRRVKPDVVGIQVFHTDKEKAFLYLKGIKEFKKDIITVIGGPYSSCEEPQNIFKFFGEYLDYAFCGESEVGFKKLLRKISIDDLKYEEIEGLIYKEKGKIKKNEPIFLENLDVLNPPLWELIQPQKYPLSPQGRYFRKYPICSINISRGCPFKCSFCAGYKITGNKVRYRSISNVLEEIKLLYEKYGIKEFHIIDDNFTFDKNYVISLCEELIKLNLKLNFACPNGVRLDTLDRDELLLMKHAGFYILHVGIESGSNRILKYMHKNLTTEKIKNRLYLIKNLKFDICGYFIFGYPKEKFFERLKNIFFAMSLPLVGVMFMNFMPIPSTEAYKEFSQKNIKFYKKTFYATFVNNFFGSFILKLTQILGMFLFYIRPHILIKNLLYIKTFENFLYVFKRILRILIVW